MKERAIVHQRGRDAMFKVWHAADMAMILYTHSNGGSIVCAEKSYPISPGALCFIGAGKYHYTMPDDSEAYDRSKLFLSSEHLRAIAKLLPTTPLPTPFTDEAFVYAEIPEEARAEVESLFVEVAREERNETHREWLLLSAVCKLLVYLDRYSLESVPRAAGVMSEAIEYINHHLFRELTIDEICAAVHVSKYYFCRRFKEKTGMTVMEYVLKTRLVMAKELLEKEKTSITEVASRCGFCSLSYFSRIFKEETGMTPMAYRRGQRG